MPVICEIKCEKSKNECCDLKSFQDFSKFGFGAFLNDLSVKLRNMSLYLKIVKILINVRMSLRVFLVGRYLIMLQSKY